MPPQQPSHPQPPPLPGAAQPQPKRKPPVHAAKKRSRFAWLWVLLLLIGGAGFLYWQYELAKFRLFGFQPPEMAAARYTPKDVIGDLGGLKVRIPRHYAEYVEYDDDPSWGEKRKGPVPERTFDSKLRSFGLEARFPDMVGLENSQLQQEYRSYNLNPDNPWIRISINSGDHYPSLGANARNGLAKGIDEHSQYWWDNYERLSEKLYGLEAYFLKGLNPQTGAPARGSDNTYDVYIHRESSGHVNTYIQCGHTSTPGGIARCRLHFGLEPEAKVFVTVSFYPKLLPRWKEIQQSARDLLLSFEVKEATTP